MLTQKVIESMMFSDPGEAEKFRREHEEAKGYVVFKHILFKNENTAVFQLKKPSENNHKLVKVNKEGGVK